MAFMRISSAFAQINETFATLVSLKPGMNAAVPDAPKTAAKHAGQPEPAQLVFDTSLQCQKNGLLH